MIVCVAVVGHQNNPLFIQSFTDADDALKLHHIVHCSLDVIEERVNNPKKSGTTLNEAFLGLLYPTVNYKVYGYLTNTKVKFILVTTDLDVRDTDVRSFFRKFHAAYVDAVSNPFHIPGKKITSRTFAETLYKSLLQTYINSDPANVEKSINVDCDIEYHGLVTHSDKRKVLDSVYTHYILQ